MRLYGTLLFLLYFTVAITCGKAKRDVTGVLKPVKDAVVNLNNAATSVKSYKDASKSLYDLYQVFSINPSLT